MAEKFRGKYRDGTFRWQNWDYGQPGAYFITICTQDREHFFGRISDGKLIVYPAGAIAFILWYEIKNHNPNVELGEFVVMPDYVHGILVLGGRKIVNRGTVG